MGVKSKWYKEDPSDRIWWKDSECIGDFVFSFDKVKEYNMFRDYPWKLSKEEKEIFDNEYPHWKMFFGDRQEKMA